MNRLGQLVRWLREDAPAWLQYGYFLRFSLLLWGTLPLLIVLDVAGVSTSVTRVLLTCCDGWQAMYATASVVLVGWLALLLARVVCVYGPRRFGVETPPALAVEAGTMRLRVLLWAQIPGVLLLAYILYLSLRDAAVPFETPFEPRISVGYLLLGTAAGMVEAAAIWFALGWLYNLMHTSAGAGEEIYEFVLPYKPQGTGLAAMLLRRTVGRAKEAESPAGPPPPQPKSYAASLAGTGYLSSDHTEIGSGHALAAFVTLGFLVLYFLLAWISFPLPGGSIHFSDAHTWLGRAHVVLSWSDHAHRSLGRATGGAWTGFVAFALAAVLLLLWLWRRTRRKQNGWLLPASLLLGVVWIFIAREPHYPAIGTILTLLMLFGSVLAGLGFFLDRFRVPALLTLIVLLWGWKRVAPTDHVYPVHATAATMQAAPNPKGLTEEFLAAHAKADAEAPVIIVTATGGGIHAAYWTSTVLDGLESEFAHSQNAVPFHNRILLMSSASGGSVAVGNWVAERDYLNPAVMNGKTRPCSQLTVGAAETPVLHNAANQASVEAVAWGLLHTDLWRMVIPWGRFGHDRAWFLEQANVENLYVLNHPPANGETLDDMDFPADWNQSCGIVALRPEFSAMRGGQNNIPAFSLNATAVETGERFLLSNYMPPQSAAIAEPLGIPNWESADSFLSQYTQQPAQAEAQPGAKARDYGRGTSYDMNIATAARLSANFPYVSPVDRADTEGDCNSVGDAQCGTFHLADGGYYDNDGVATAVEFLWLALGRGSLAVQADPKTGGSAAAGSRGSHEPMQAEAASAPHNERILLIQIRDSPLPPDCDNWSTAVAEDALAQSEGISQSLAPVHTVYSSWHVSESTRNQRELSALGAGLQPGVKLYTVQFAYPSNPGACRDPHSKPISTTLNWRLTRSDQKAIADAWTQQAGCAQELVRWSDQPGQGLPTTSSNAPVPDVCSGVKP